MKAAIAAAALCALGAAVIGLVVWGMLAIIGGAPLVDPQRFAPTPTLSSVKP